MRRREKAYRWIDLPQALLRQKNEEIKKKKTLFLGINNLLVGPEFWINTSGGRRDVMGKEHCG